jgi:uncharacterized membrane protein (UPF0127 family)
MLVYIENEIKNNKQVMNFLNKYQNVDVIYIDNYKNIFWKYTLPYEHHPHSHKEHTSCNHT